LAKIILVENRRNSHWKDFRFVWRGSFIPIANNCSLAKIDLGIVQKQKYCPEIGNTKLSSEIKRKIPTAGMFEIGAMIFVSATW